VSFTNPADAPPSIFPAVQHAVEHALAQVGPYLASLLQRAAPTPQIMKALAEELRRATVDPRSVSHPELLDPGVFWERSAWPQAAAVVKNAREALLAIADELAIAVQGSEHVLEAWLAAQVQADLTRPDGNRITDRDAAIDAVVAHCESLHRLVARLGALAPTTDHLHDARAAVDALRRAEAERAAHAQRDAEERALDPSQRAAFERSWQAGFAQDVAVRDHELRASTPFRHQDLLLAAGEQAVEAIAHDVEELVQELTEPILGIGERMVRRYDELAGGFSVPAPTAAPTFGAQ
jgi:hypothetical protein